MTLSLYNYFFIPAYRLQSVFLSSRYLLKHHDTNGRKSKDHELNSPSRQRHADKQAFFNNYKQDDLEQYDFQDVVTRHIHALFTRFCVLQPSWPRVTQESGLNHAWADLLGGLGGVKPLLESL
jgi:hypothetical protein